MGIKYTIIQFIYVVIMLGPSSGSAHLIAWGCDMFSAHKLHMQPCTKFSPPSASYYM